MRPGNRFFTNWTNEKPNFWDHFEKFLRKIGSKPKNRPIKLKLKALKVKEVFFDKLNI